jgi:toxin ParE1/3/4
MSEDAGRNPQRIVILSPSAIQDETDVYNYTLSLWGQRQAEEYVDFLDQVMWELAHNPAIASSVPQLTGVRSHIARWKNTRQGHRIFFEEMDDGIYVLRILHTAMNWLQHLNADE